MTPFGAFAAKHWEISARLGMLRDCTFLQPGGGVPKTVKVRWCEPDETFMSGARSKQYEIEYLATDMPHLAEGDALSVEDRPGCKTDFYVREAPFVDPEGGEDGTYRRALLTREKARS